MKKVFFSLIFGCFVINSAQADGKLAKYEEECLSFIKPPKVELTSTYGKLKYNYSKDSAFLRQETAKRFEDLGESLYDGFEPVGLTKVRDAFDFGITVGQINISNGYTCLYPETINVHLGYYVPTIYILNSLKKGTCLYDMAVRHEKTHMQIYLEALDYFLPQLKEAVNGLFGTIGVKVVKRAEAGRSAAQELNDLYLKPLQDIVNRWRKEVEKEQLKLDTPEHYIIENKLCEEIEGSQQSF